MESPPVAANGDREAPWVTAPEEPGSANRGREAWSGLRAFRIPLVVGLAIALLSVYVAGGWRDSDVSVYHAYALGFWGALAHPLLPSEYPPLSILPFALTLTGPTRWSGDAFAFWMALAFGLGYLAIRRCAGPRQAGTYVIYVLAAGPATLLFRYDLFPAMLLVAAVWLLERKRFAAVYPLIAVGALLKLFPLMLLPVAIIAHWRSRRGRVSGTWRGIVVGTAACIVIIVAGFGAAVFIDPAHGLGALTYNFKRPFEVESVPSTLLWLGSLVGIPAHADASFGSFNLVGSLSGLISVVADVALVTGLLWTYWRYLRGQLTTSQTALAAILVALCTSKVLNAQYMLWAAPMLAITLGFQMRWLAVSLLTAVIFPTLFEIGTARVGPSVAFSTILLAGVAVRNVVLLVVTWRYLLAPGGKLLGYNQVSAELSPATPWLGRPQAAEL
jgi:hypothetical protein